MFQVSTSRGRRPVNRHSGVLSRQFTKTPRCSSVILCCARSLAKRTEPIARTGRGGVSLRLCTAVLICNSLRKETAARFGQQYGQVTVSVLSSPRHWCFRLPERRLMQVGSPQARTTLPHIAFTRYRKIQPYESRRRRRLTADLSWILWPLATGFEAQYCPSSVATSPRAPGGRRRASGSGKVNQKL